MTFQHHFPVYMFHFKAHNRSFSWNTFITVSDRKMSLWIASLVGISGNWRWLRCFCAEKIIITLFWMEYSVDESDFFYFWLVKYCICWWANSCPVITTTRLNKWKKPSGFSEIWIISLNLYCWKRKRITLHPFQQELKHPHDSSGLVWSLVWYNQIAAGENRQKNKQTKKQADQAWTQMIRPLGTIEAKIGRGLKYCWWLDQQTMFYFLTCWTYTVYHFRFKEQFNH